MMAHRLVLSAAIVAVATLLAHRAAGYPWQDCGDGQYAAGSKYLANINLLAASLPKNASASPDLFATAEAGAAPDKVWALALCRGDANATSCLNCLSQAFRDLPNVCDYSKVATMHYDSCTLHYSNASSDPAPVAARTYRYWEPMNVTSEKGQFNRLVARLVNATADYAAYNSTRRYASGEADFDREFPKIDQEDGRRSTIRSHPKEGAGRREKLSRARRVEPTRRLTNNSSSVGLLLDC